MATTTNEIDQLRAEIAALRAAGAEVARAADAQRKFRNGAGRSSGITIGLDRALDVLRPLVGAPPAQIRQM